MDYTSFAPDGKSSNPNISTPETPSPRKNRTPKLIGIIIIILIIAAAAYSAIWYWQGRQTTTPSPSASAPAGSVVYRNEQYGFEIDLPQSWDGYTTMTDNWQGRDVASGNVTESGPLITLRNPAWTQNDQTEDMPVMVFTPEQWQKIQNEQLSVSAAPIPPSLLGQNSKYVLALPARYNYDFKTGYQEVDQLVHGLKAFEPSGQ